MNSAASAWSRLDGRRRAIVVAATLAMFAAVAFLARGPGPGQMALLYAGLEPGAAGDVIAALEGRGVAFEVRGDAIWVPEASRDLERMSLAAEGLPAVGGGGYEILDALSGFGTTAQMFDAAYWRAREGELARTILAGPGIRAARVHIAADAGSPFRRDGRPTAAVTVTTRDGTLLPGQARALSHLIAAAVPGLAPADVAVIDSVGGLMASDDDQASPDAQAAALRERALRLIEARVGPGNAVVEVSVETVTETESLRERTVDPTSRVAISTEAAESETASQGTAGGQVTVASNLPDPNAAAGGGSSDSGTESRTLTNFDVSETSREVIRAPGAVRRLTVAVLINDVATTDPEGLVTVTPRDPAELDSLGALVGSAVGLDEERGDRLTIRSMPFEVPALPGSDPALPGGPPLDLMGWAQPVLLAIVAIVLGLFVVRPILRPAPLALPAPDGSVPGLPAPGYGGEAPGYGGMGMGGDMGMGSPLGLAPPMGIGEGGASQGWSGYEPGGVADAEIVDPVTRLRRLIESRQEETAQILQTWLDEPGRAPAEKA